MGDHQLRENSTYLVMIAFLTVGSRLSKRQHYALPVMSKPYFLRKFPFQNCVEMLKRFIAFETLIYFSFGKWFELRWNAKG